MNVVCLLVSVWGVGKGLGKDPLAWGHMDCCHSVASTPIPLPGAPSSNPISSPVYQEAARDTPHPKGKHIMKLGPGTFHPFLGN